MVLKLSLIPFDKTVSEDATLYYYYAAELAYHQKLPSDTYSLHNIGLPLFLAPIFSFFPPDHLILSNVQRISTVLFSCLTIPIMYKICRYFFNQKLSLIGSAMMAFEPRIIQNSSFGITEPLFLVFSMASFYFIIHPKFKYSYLSFIFAGLATTQRFEGFALLVVISIILFTKKKRISSLLIMSGLFLVPVIAVGYVNLSTGNSDGFISKINHEVNFVKEPTKNTGFEWLPRIINSFLYMGWSTFPMFIFFIPLGIYQILKKKRFSPLLLVCLTILLVPGLYAYLDAHDTRYFMPAYPILVIISVQAIERLMPNNFFKSH